MVSTYKKDIEMIKHFTCAMIATVIIVIGYIVDIGIKEYLLLCTYCLSYLTLVKAFNLTDGRKDKENEKRNSEK